MVEKRKCIKSVRYLTVGKTYKIKPSQMDSQSYWVFQDDLKRGGLYSKEFFQSIEDARDDKIIEIVK